MEIKPPPGSNFKKRLTYWVWTQMDMIHVLNVLNPIRPLMQARFKTVYPITSDAVTDKAMEAYFYAVAQYSPAPDATQKAQAIWDAAQLSYVPDGPKQDELTKRVKQGLPGVD